MADKLLCIEIGNSLTKIAEVEKGKNIKVTEAFSVLTPEGVLRDGAVDPTAEFVDLLRTAFSEHKIKTKKVIYTISSGKIATREAVLPYMKENKVIEAVRANLTDYFPVELRQYKFAHSILKTISDDPNGKGKPTSMKLQLMAAPKLLLDSYQRLSEALGCQMVSEDYNINSLFQAVREDCNEGVQLVIKVDDRNSAIMVLDEGVQALNRTIPYGIDDLFVALGEIDSLGKPDYAKAQRLSYEKSVLMPAMESGDAVHAEGMEEHRDFSVEDKKFATENLRPFIGGVIRVVDFYNSNHNDRHVSQIVLTGTGADVAGLVNLLSHETGLPVRTLDFVGNTPAEKAFGSGVFYGEFITCVAAAIAPMESYLHEDEDGGTGGSKAPGFLGEVDSTVIAVVILVLCIAATIGLLLWAYIPYMKEKRTNKEYTDTIDEMQSSHDIYLEYITEKSKNEKYHKINNATKNRNVALMAFVEQMEKDMPSSFIISAMSADLDSIVINATVNSREEVAAVLDRLQRIDIFSGVYMNSVSKIENVLGEIQYSFTVTLSYLPMVFDEAGNDISVGNGEEEAEAAGDMEAGDNATGEADSAAGDMEAGDNATGEADPVADEAAPTAGDNTSADNGNAANSEATEAAGATTGNAANNVATEAAGATTGNAANNAAAANMDGEATE